jgi:hypothetical protein
MATREEAHASDSACSRAVMSAAGRVRSTGTYALPTVAGDVNGHFTKQNCLPNGSRMTAHSKNGAPPGG